jgi:hypothetical protein
VGLFLAGTDPHRLKPAPPKTSNSAIPCEKYWLE